MRIDIREFRALVEEALRTGWDDVDAEMAEELVAKHRELISSLWRRGKGYDDVAAEIVLLEFPSEDEDDEELGCSCGLGATPSSVAYTFVEQGRGRGFFPGHQLCVHAVSMTDARNVARAYMARPKLVGKGCTGKSASVMSDAARALARQTLYPENKELWGTADTPNRLSISNLRKRVTHWIEKNVIDGDTREMRWYTKQQWLDRGEEHGRNAPLTVTIEGAHLYMILNYPERPDQFAIHDAFYEFVKTLGYYAELGYAWSLHFYPK